MFTVELKSGIENLVVEFARTDGAGGAKWPDPASLRTVITTKGGEELIVPIADAKVLGDVHETLRLGDCKVVAVIHIGTRDEMHALADARAGRAVQPREDDPGLRAILELIDTRFEHCTTAHDVLRGIEAIVRSEIGKRVELVKKEAVDIPNDPPFGDHTRIAHAALLSVRKIIDGSKATLVERVDQIYTRTCRAMLDMGLLVEARGVIDCGTMCTTTDIERVCLKCLRNAVHDSNMKLAPDDAPTKSAKQNLGDITRSDLEVLVQMRESMSRAHRHHLPEARALDRIIEIVKSHGRPHSESK